MRPRFPLLLSIALVVAVLGATPGAVARVAPDDTAAPLPEATTRPAPAAMTLAGQPAWVSPDGIAVLELRVRQPANGLEIRVVAHRAVTSRTEFDRVMGGKELGRVEGRLSMPLSSLTTDSDGDRQLTLGVQGQASPVDPGRIVPGRSGVYPLEIELRRRREGVVGSFVTPLVVLAPGVVPLTLAWVWRLDATPARTPDGDIRPVASRAFGPEGRLGRMVEAALAAGDVPLTLAPTPETFDAWAQVGDRRSEGEESESEGMLSRLRRTISDSSRQILLGPYVPIDTSALATAGADGEIDQQFARGAGILNEILGLSALPTTLLAGSLDNASLSRLRQYGVERLVVSPSVLEPVVQRLTPGRPFSLAGRGRPFPATMVDSDLAALLADDGPPALVAARFLASLSLVALEAPREPRGVVVVTPDGWNPPSSLLTTILSGLRSHPAVAPRTVDDFFATVPPEVRDGDPLTRSLAEKTGTAPKLDAEKIGATRSRLAAFTQVVGEGEALPRTVDRVLLVSQSSSLKGGRLSTKVYLDGADRIMTRVTGRVRGPDGQRVTLTARRAKIPISLLNPNPRPLRVLVRLESDQLQFPDGAERLLTLPPENTTENFVVETRASGAFPLVINVTSPDGALVVNRSELTIRSTVVSGVGALLTVGAGVFLLVWWVNHLRRSRRRRRPAIPTG